MSPFRILAQLCGALAAALITLYTSYNFLVNDMPFDTFAIVTLLALIYVGVTRYDYPLDK